MSDDIYIGLGSNQGDREGMLFAAVDALRRNDLVAVNRCSSIYESAPIGPPQERYLNAVVQLGTALEPPRLLGLLKGLERELGRSPSSARWGPRPIDLDILLWGRRVVAESNLQVPHLELHKRRFALEPLCELVPDAQHPITGERMCDMLKKLAEQQCVRIGCVRPLVVTEAE